jgi:hypothetical protein
VGYWTFRRTPGTMSHSDFGAVSNCGLGFSSPDLFAVGALILGRPGPRTTLEITLDLLFRWGYALAASRVMSDRMATSNSLARSGDTPPQPSRIGPSLPGSSVHPLPQNSIRAPLSGEECRRLNPDRPVRRIPGDLARAIKPAPNRGWGAWTETARSPETCDS